LAPRVLAPWLLVSLACGLDRLVGDPSWCLHPVQVMGWWIARLRRLAEAWAADVPWKLRLAGGLITALLVLGSAAAGWALERLTLATQGPGSVLAMGLLLLGLASALAGRSLEQAVEAVLRSLPAADPAAAPGTPAEVEAALRTARARLSWIVGRDTTSLDQAEILRAAAETASENAVDGLFAPLAWMLLGAGLWCWLVAGGIPLAEAVCRIPGPLALAWGFKASSTLDSMLGYRHGRLLWLGTAGARLDDLLTWLPCRLVALSLPLAAARPGRTLVWFRGALEQGASDPSPNAGVSQAAYALAAGVRLGGTNRYPEGLRHKPVLAPDHPEADASAVRRMLGLSARLELIWILLSGLVFLQLGPG
jgi:adenosylcobinamide-phosphate synthase